MMLEKTPSFDLAPTGVGLAQTSVNKYLFDFKSREFGDINNIFNGLHVGLECDFNGDVSTLAIDTNDLSPPPPQPAINSSPTGVGLSQTSVIDNDLYAVSPALVIIITNKNKNKIEYESGPAIGTVFNFSLNGAGLGREYIFKNRRKRCHED